MLLSGQEIIICWNQIKYSDSLIGKTQDITQFSRSHEEDDIRSWPRPSFSSHACLPPPGCLPPGPQPQHSQKNKSKSKHDDSKGPYWEAAATVQSMRLILPEPQDQGNRSESS